MDVNTKNLTVLTASTLGISVVNFPSQCEVRRIAAIRVRALCYGIPKRPFVSLVQERFHYRGEDALSCVRSAVGRTGARWRVMESAGFRTLCISSTRLMNAGSKRPRMMWPRTYNVLIRIILLCFHGLTEFKFCFLAGEHWGTSVETRQRSFALRTLPENPEFQVEVVIKHCSQQTKEKVSRSSTGGEVKPRREPTSWTQDEKTFAEILRNHGKDWRLLHESLPSKSLTQIKTYFQNSKAKLGFPTTEGMGNTGGRGGETYEWKAEDSETNSNNAGSGGPLYHQKFSSVSPSEVDITSHQAQ